MKIKLKEEVEEERSCRIAKKEDDETLVAVLYAMHREQRMKWESVMWGQRIFNIMF